MPVPGGNKKRDYSRYDQMSTAELEQILRLDFQASKDGASDLDAMLYISDLLAKRNGPSDADAAWEQFQTQYRPYTHGRSLYDLGDGEDTPVPKAEQAPPVPPAAQRQSARCRRLAVLAAALIVCLLGAMAVAQAAGVDVLGAIARWTDEAFHFVPADSSSPSSSGAKEMEQLRSSLQTWGMEDQFPTWYPDGFCPGELNITQLNIRVTADVTFYGEDRSYSVWVDHFTQPTDDTGTFEKDSTPVEEYIHNGWMFYILSNVDTLTATAYNGEFMIMISGMLTREEIKTIIDSIPAPA